MIVNNEYGEVMDFYEYNDEHYYIATIGNIKFKVENITVSDYIAVLSNCISTTVELETIVIDTRRQVIMITKDGYWVLKTNHSNVGLECIYIDMIERYEGKGKSKGFRKNYIIQLVYKNIRHNIKIIEECNK